MNTLIVKEIRLYNFKGFETLSLNLQDSLISILGGKNGFGKTTIFDALELVLTGVIGRFSNYVGYHDSRKVLSDNHKPLVYSRALPHVQVEIVFDCGGDELIIYRKATTASMKNPISFKPFEKLYIRKDNEDREYSNEDELQYHIKSFGRSYSFLNYISQEDTTSYLKSKDLDRSKMIQELFNTKDIDERIEKTQKALKFYRLKCSEYNNVLDNIKTEIDFLEIQDENVVKSASYIKLAIDKKWDWDEENPDLAFDRYSELLQKGGLFDEIDYFVQNKTQFELNRKNEWLEWCRSDEMLSSLYYYFKYSKDDIESYKKYRNIVRLTQKLTIESFSSDFFSKVRSQLDGLILDEGFEELKYLSDSLLSVLQASNNIEEIVNALILHRNNLALSIEANNEDFKLKACPLCGNDYCEPNILQDAIKQHMPSFLASFNYVKQDSLQLFYSFKEYLSNKMLLPLRMVFKSLHIDDIVCEEYDKLDATKILELYNILKDDFALKIDIKEDLTIEDFISKLSAELLALKQEVDTSLDYQQMTRIFESYLGHIDPTMWVLEIIDQKRQYLSRYWNSKKTDFKRRKEKEFYLYETLVIECKGKEKNLKKIAKQLTDKRTGYINKLVSDIEILFYIYSGRVMQDSTFGRGLFLKYENNRVLFVSNYQHDIDALYHLSSGQLVAVIYSFTLALNKLYSKYPFIAIDDPVQTIDDINIWGLVETLRHEFANSCIMLSTHEADYGSFLRYKFSKWGIPTQYIDMGKCRNN